MTKKFLLVAALVGALSLGSCVDNSESESVTAVRNAKVEQLKSLANLNNAEAEAKTIAANAEAALMQAQAEQAKAVAEYTKAQAEVEKAKVAYQEALTESQKATAAQNLAKAESLQAQAAIDKANAEATIKKIDAQLEYDLQRLQNDLLSAKQQYINNLKNLTDAEKSQFTKLVSDYTVAARNVINARKELAGMQRTLRAYENGLADINDTKDQAILDMQKQITEWEKEIANMQAQIDVYAQYTTPAEAEAALKAAENTLLDLQKKQAVAGEAASKTAKAAADAASKIEPANSQFMNLIVTNFADGSTNEVSDITLTQDKTGKNVGFNQVDDKGNTTFIPLYTTEQTKTQKITYTLEEGAIPANETYEEITSAYVLDADGFKSYFAQAETNITNTPEVTAAKKTADDAAKTQEAADKKVADLTSSIATLKATQKDTGVDLSAQITTLENELATAKTDAAAAKTAATEATKTYNELAEAAAKNVEKLAELKEVYADLTAAAPTFQKQLTAINSARKANAEANVVVEQANFAVEQQQATVDALALSSAGEDAKAQIKSLEEQIKNLEANIKSYNKQIDDVESITSQEEMIAFLQEEIDNKKLEISALEKISDEAKAELESAINGIEE